LRRLLSIIVVALAACALLAAGAQAASIRNPKLGPWVTSGGGFNLAKGTGKYRGKVMMSNFHMTSGDYAGCPEPPVTATVLGKFPLKVFTRGGYSVWGIGRNVKGEAEPTAAKVRAGSQTYTGSFRLIWDFEAVTTEVLGGTIQFGECSIYLSSASPKPH
jgi:hypothetical protein